MKLTFFSAHPTGEGGRLLGKTRREVHLQIEALGAPYGEPKKVTVTFRDNFELLVMAIRGAL